MLQLFGAIVDINFVQFALHTLTRDASYSGQRIQCALAHCSSLECLEVLAEGVLSAASILAELAAAVAVVSVNLKSSFPMRLKELGSVKMVCAHARPLSNRTHVPRFAFAKLIHR
ncbi:MAG: hypothetical protein AAGM67_12890, partial [Bacteroidota bacterium]